MGQGEGMAKCGETAVVEMGVSHLFKTDLQAEEAAYVTYCLVAQADLWSI